MNNLGYDNHSLLIQFVKELIKEEYLTKEEILHLVDSQVVGSQEQERIKMEKWYKMLGIERILQRPFHLSKCYFSDKEMQYIRDNNEYLLCLPAGINARKLAKLFRLDSWACSNELVTQFEESEDFWFATSMNMEPDYLGQSGFEVMKQYKKQDKLNMSLERYMVYFAYVNTFTGVLPDQKYKVWLPNSRYEEKAMLIAGSDSSGDFSTHAWMPQFHTPLVGARYVRIADHL